MRRITQTLAVILLLTSCSTLSAQLYTEPFDTDLNGWTPAGSWVWDANGAADGIPGVAWDNRSRLRSESLGGAALFANPEVDGQLTSPIIDLPPGTTTAFLSFYLYFRSEGGNPRVRILDIGGTGVFEETLLGDLQNGQETSAGYFAILDISGVIAAGISSFRIEFDVEGANTFWLVDDVIINAAPPRRPTFPRYLGESLTDFGIPFVTDSTGAAAVPFQLVADFLPNVSEPDRAKFRQLFNAVKVSTCVCDRIEVWELPGGLFFDSNGQPLGDPTDILERTIGSGTMSEIDGLDLNYYSYNDLENTPDVPNAPLSITDLTGLPLAPVNAVKIAILDTGLDLDHPDLNGFLFRDGDPIGDGNDDDSDCYPDNPIGWNFVDDNNNPNDDNGHGTHVSGIVADYVRDCSDCEVQIIPYKTHNNYGVGTLFSTTCATLQAAVNDGADVINASWGFYGGTSVILQSAIDTAANYGATLIAAAGNDSLNLIADPQYPATYPLANILSVSAVDSIPSGSYPLAGFSNYHADYVDIAAFGVAVESSIPGGSRALKAGTSMATPAVAAAAVLYGCDNSGDFSGVKSAILSGALAGGPDMIGQVLDENVLPLAATCPPPTTVNNQGGTGVGFTVRPNPAFSEIIIEAYEDLGPTRITIYATGGTQMATRRVPRFSRGEQEVFEVNDLTSGQYLITLEYGGRIRTRRLVKR